MQKGVRNTPQRKGGSLWTRKDHVPDGGWNGKIEVSRWKRTLHNRNQEDLQVDKSKIFILVPNRKSNSVSVEELKTALLKEAQIIKISKKPNAIQASPFGKSILA